MPNLVKERLINLMSNDRESYYELYSFFLDPEISNFEKEKKADIFLNRELEKNNVNAVDVDFLININSLKNWFLKENENKYKLYKEYLNRRKSGRGREYFKNISHALEFLVKVAPVKKVDGSWLYSAINYWNDKNFHDLIIIYLEELGLGDAKLNHVKMFDDLLESLGLENFGISLSDNLYHQAAIQLALGYASPEYIPEILGFNLGYEQLPLHLLITNYELKELGIDSLYFNSHITIDNIDNGHADRAIKAIQNFYNQYKDKQVFLKKISKGYALNDIGISSVDIINQLNLKSIVVKILEKKALVGKFIHSDRCKFMNKTINEWLDKPEGIEGFLDLMVEKKWIIRGENPKKSRFWNLVDNPNGQMFGVFSATEKQFIYDWILGDTYTNYNVDESQIHLKNPEFHDYYFKFVNDDKLKDIQKLLNQTNSLGIKIKYLINYLAPHNHHNDIGLWCTYQYSQYLFPQLHLRART